MKLTGMTKRIACAALAAALFALSLLTVPALETPEITNVASAYLYNIENGKVLYSENETASREPASTVKIMVALLAYEALTARMDETVTVTAEMVKGVVGNNIGLSDGENIKISDLFTALILRGANDAAQALAILTSGSVKEFIAAMNKRADELGATSTTYANVTGLHDDDARTTAVDVARVSEAFVKNTALLDISSAAKIILPATNTADRRTLYNRNFLISKYSETKYFCAFAKGVDSGYTKEAGYTVTGFAENGGLSYIAVILGGEEIDGTNYAYSAAKKLLTYGITGFGYISVVPKQFRACEIPVALSTDADFVTLTPRGELSAYLPIDTNTDTELTYRQTLLFDTLDAPVTEGTVAGYITVSLGDDVIGSIELVTTNSVERSGFLYMLDIIRGFAESRFFIATVIAAVLITIGFVLVKAYIRGKRLQKGRRRYK